MCWRNEALDILLTGFVLASGDRTVLDGSAGLH